MIALKAMATRTSLSEIIRRFRKQSKMTQTDLALKVGVSKAAISQFERAEARPSFETMKKISDVLNADLTELYYEARPLREASKKEISYINEKATLLELLQQKLDEENYADSQNAILHGSSQRTQTAEELIARAIAITREAAMMRTYHLGENPSPDRDYDDRLYRRMGCELSEAVRLIDSGRLRYQLIADRPIVTEQAVRDFFGDTGTWPAA
ncbi:helix-turn-helix domain-containing protein [Hymenobacter ginsengisoli]|uniref:helix-turn-helix domain-containing protein n=1 Tax=Hymenobacter ginsengisoli TaxID=1051626 RepID=UPI0031E8DA02